MKPFPMANLVQRKMKMKSWRIVSNHLMQRIYLVSKMALAARECANCGVIDVALFACSSCKQTYYCSKICQTNDWKKGHKESCKKLSVQPNDPVKAIR